MLLKKTNYLTCNNLKFGRLAISGRNNFGKISIRRRGGAVQRVYRLVDFLRYVSFIPALLLSLEYDPNRTALLNLLSYSNSVLSFVLAVGGLSIASIVTTDTTTVAQKQTGYASYLKNIRPGLYINCLELKPLSFGKYVRAGSTYAKLVSIASDFSIVKLRSRFLLRLNNFCTAVIGLLTHKTTFRYKRKNAGFSRRVGRRPAVRGVAMNPIDHPHGGGQGKTSGGRVSVSPWAKITKGKKTRKKINYATSVLKRKSL